MAILFDRLARRGVDGLPTEPLIGRYIVADEQVTVNGIAGAGYVVADREGRVSIRSADGQQTARGQPPSIERPLRLTTDALEEISDSFICTESFEDLLGHACSPLASPNPEQGRPTELDVLVDEGAPHLLATAQRPHSRLEATVEHMAVARAKRVPARSIEYLAAHSEDWQRRTPGGLIPRKLLARRLEERFDIYENRVAARLTDKVISYLQRREAELRQLSALYRDIADFNNLLAGGYLLVRRLSHLWDEGLTAAATDLRPDALAAHLESTRLRLSAILGSELYQAVPRLAGVGNTLLTTNVLASDQNYRRLPPVWDALISAGEQEIDDTEHHRREQRRCENFELYCRLLLLRSLFECGLRPRSNDWPEPEAASQLWRLWDRSTPVEVRASRREGMVVTRGGETILRILPLASEICALSADLIAEPPRVARRLREVMEGCDSRVHTAVLYLGTRGQREQLPEPLACATNGVPDELERDDANCILVPVSPLDLLSLERVARLVRFVLLGRRLREYPPRATCPRALRPDLIAALDWVDADADDRDRIKVLEPPEGRRLKELSAWFAGQLKGLRPKHDDARRKALQDAREAITAETVVAEFATLQECPICQGSGRLLRRDRDSFRVRCGRCESEWGLRVCECGNRIPFLRPNNPRPVEEPVSERLDLSFGRDVLTAPCPLDGQEYPCHACGRCEGRHRAGMACDRCRSREFLFHPAWTAGPSQ